MNLDCQAISLDSDTTIQRLKKSTLQTESGDRIVNQSYNQIQEEAIGMQKEYKRPVSTSGNRKLVVRNETG